MTRREFITLLGGAAVAWPVGARAQQAERVRQIGVLMGVADDREGQARVRVLKQGLQELGWTDGRNIQVETRFGGADADRIRAHAAELVALGPDVIVANTTPVIRAVRPGGRSRRLLSRLTACAVSEYLAIHLSRPRIYGKPCANSAGSRARTSR